jgi:ATP-binding cassette subfamily A (ABC1) protein 3
LQVGTEISFKLPLASSSSFESMFREIESCMRRSVCNSKTSGSEDKDYLGIESYGISVTTLEEVFLRVAGCDYNEAECIEHKEDICLPDAVDSQASHDHVPKKLGNYKYILGVISTIVGRACGLIFAAVLSFINFLSIQCSGCCFISRSTFWQHFRALFIKRAISARRDRKTIVFQLLIPAVFLLIGLLFLKLKPHPDQQSLTFTTSQFNPLLSGGGGGGPIPFDLSWPIAKEVC